MSELTEDGATATREAEGETVNPRTTTRPVSTREPQRRARSGRRIDELPTYLDDDAVKICRGTD